jgi:hypothetical protein
LAVPSPESLTGVSWLESDPERLLVVSLAPLGLGLVWWQPVVEELFAAVEFGVVLFSPVPSWVPVVPFWGRELQLVQVRLLRQPLVEV